MEQTQDEKDQQMIQEIERKIEDVVELLALRKDVDEVDDDLETKSAEKEKHKNTKELAWLPHKTHKNIAVNKHTKTTMELIQSLKHKQKLLDNPANLLKHLDTLTERLLTVVKRQCKKSKKSK